MKDVMSKDNNVQYIFFNLINFNLIFKNVFSNDLSL